MNTHTFSRNMDNPFDNDAVYTGLALFGTVAKNAMSENISADIACDVAMKCVLDQCSPDYEKQEYHEMVTQALQLLAHACVENEDTNDHLLLPLVISDDPMPVVKMFLRQFCPGGKYQETTFESWLLNFGGRWTMSDDDLRHFAFVCVSFLFFEILCIKNHIFL